LGEADVVLIDEQWPVARLIPISSASGVEAQERRAASALLAVLGAVPEFAHTLLKPLGAPKGKVRTFIEVPFKLHGRSIRPDGIITVSRGSNTWGAIVETKVGPSGLEVEQMDAYLDLAKELGFEAVLSISNHYVTSSTEYPIDVDRRKLKKVSLHHWSWVDVLTEAVVQKEHRGVSDPDQAYILNELIRYMSDARSGVLTFEGMGSGWTKVRDGAREGTLRKGDPEVAAVAARWDDLIRYVGLDLTKMLGRDVKHVLPKEERTPTARQGALRDSLASSGVLYAEISVPDTSGLLVIRADLRAKQVALSTSLHAPKEGRSKGRVSWLLRQLQNAPDTLTIEARLGRGQSLAAALAKVRETPEVLHPDPPKEIRVFVLTHTRNMGVKKDASKGSFVDSVLSATQEFYTQILQNLRPWKPAPPKARKADSDEAEPEETIVGVSPAVTEALEEAHQEQEELQGRGLQES
jgi:hypothetical protein